jgi:hypothetical protein
MILERDTLKRPHVSCTSCCPKCNAKLMWINTRWVRDNNTFTDCGTCAALNAVDMVSGNVMTDDMERIRCLTTEALNAI